MRDDKRRTPPTYSRHHMVFGSRKMNLDSNYSRLESKHVRPVVAITMGDPAGVGPELCLQTLAEPEVFEHCVPVIFGDAGVMRRVAAACELPEPGSVITLDDWRAGESAQQPALIDCGAIDAESVRPGRVDTACGRAAYTYIEVAVKEALAGRVAAVVTAPINKESLHLAGVGFPGHTEIFASLTDTKRYCMMLTSEAVTAGFVTTHTAMADVPARLSVERVNEVICMTAGAMLRMRGRAPLISVCGLNPHAGEHGLFGREEELFIEPAIAAARERGVNVEGPIPPDAAFLPARRARTDAYVCMYHDQGHIPFKMLAFDTGVNVTLGLPIVRTSVDHGTAFDIAWKREASPRSLYEAIKCAVRLSRTGAK